jgi:DNA-binding SARP family transcriptional activator
VERTPVRIRVLGGFALAVHGRAVTLPVQAQRLVVLLTVRDQTPRAVAAGLLWGDVPQTRALSNLRNAAWRLNGVSTEIVEGGRDVMALRPGVSTDLDEARTLCRDLAVGLLPAGVPAALDLLEHDLMPSWDQDWLLMERERQRQARLHAAEVLSRALRAQGRLAEAVQAALTAVWAEPMRESAQRVLVEAHLVEGNVSEALRQAASYRALLAEELGIAPGVEFEALLGRVL